MSHLAVACTAWVGGVWFGWHRAASTIREALRANREEDQTP